MPSKKNRQIVIYPEYFDSKLTRLEGRRVSNDHAVPSPSLQDVASAVRRAGFKSSVEEDAGYPRHWWKKRGRVLISPGSLKTDVIRKVAEQLKSKGP